MVRLGADRVQAADLFHGEQHFAQGGYVDRHSEFP